MRLAGDRAAAGAVWAAVIGLAIAAVTVAIALTDASPASPLRHGYFVPVVVAAVRSGAGVGLLAALGAVLLDAPFVLPDIERVGPTHAAVEGLVTFALLLLGGPLVGSLTGHARRERARYETILAIHRALADEAPLEIAVVRLRACLAERLAAADLALVLRDGERLVVTGAAAVAPRSAAARVLETGAPVFASDIRAGDGPRRVLAVPLLARGATIGVLALERRGDIDTFEREALVTLGAHVGLALENARLAARQRRFADELAQKVAEATGRLAEMDRVKSTFLAIASHELRTPLTALQGFSELLAARRFPADEVQRLAGIMHCEVERLTRIVSDFLDLSRLERGLEPTLQRTAVSVAPALAAAVELFGRQHPTHRVHIECDAGLPPVDADADALDRIVKNLVSNAIKYSRPGGGVRVRARAVERGRAVEVTVEDDGQGIPPEALPRVFEPYYRAPGASETARGAGIGLAVVKSLVDAHGGSIQVESAPMRGTRMTFVLPALP